MHIPIEFNAVNSSGLGHFYMPAAGTKWASSPIQFRPETPVILAVLAFFVADADGPC
ncbi:hypothetical protein [Dyella humicola]|uniref:hypothetical protein n=1 Tax=Dyella humicola TaxID=2992126 RepID=UPI00225530B3|nr:hypothetical protein [Dyella humicola]